MIETNFFTLANGNITGFKIAGHADFDDEGGDIVCSAVSSAAYMTANTVTDILNVSAEIEVEDGYMMLRVFQKDAAVCRDIFAGFKLHMLSLEEQYSDYIIVNYTEV